MPIARAKHNPVDAIHDHIADELQRQKGRPSDRRAMSLLKVKRVHQTCGDWYCKICNAAIPLLVPIGYKAKRYGQQDAQLLETQSVRSLPPSGQDAIIIAGNGRNKDRNYLSAIQA